MKDQTGFLSRTFDERNVPKRKVEIISVAVRVDEGFTNFSLATSVIQLSGNGIWRVGKRPRTAGPPFQRGLMGNGDFVPLPPPTTVY